MNAAVKGVARSRPVCQLRRQIPKQAVRALRHADARARQNGPRPHDVVVAVGPHVSPCARAKEIDAFRLACVNRR